MRRWISPRPPGPRRAPPAWIWAAPAALLPLALAWDAGGLALGTRTEDLISHLWAIWNGAYGDPTRSALVGAPSPGGADLLPVYGGWLHTFIGSGLHRMGLEVPRAWSWTLGLLLAGTGVGGWALARALGAAPAAAGLAGLLVLLDPALLVHAGQGRPEHAGMGLPLLALAGLAGLRTAGPRRAAATGVAGALTLVAGWEQGLWLALTAAALMPALLGRDRGAWARAGLGAAVTLLLAAPWVGAFLSRALAARDPQEGLQMARDAAHQALLLGPWLDGRTVGPARMSVVALMLAPALAPVGQKGRWVWILLLQVAMVALALGPTPGWRAPADLGLYGPFVAVQAAPVLGWFHSPGRLAMGVGLFGPAALALLLSRLAGRSRALALGLGAGALGLALREAAPLIPRGEVAIPDRPEVAAVGARAREAGGPALLLDLPWSTNGVVNTENQLNQMIHGLPIPGHAWLRWLVRDQTGALLDQAPLLRWIQDGPRPGQPAGPPPLTGAEREALRSAGLRFVAVHPRWFPPNRREVLLAQLQEVLGPPITGRSTRWVCWDLGAAAPSQAGPHPAE